MFTLAVLYTEKRMCLIFILINPKSTSVCYLHCSWSISLGVEKEIKIFTRKKSFVN